MTTATLRRMVAEPFATSTYTDDELTAIIESYPTTDDDGNRPDDVDWVETYDLHAAAAQIWAEKAATVAADYNFSADGGSVNRQGVFEQYMKMHRHHNARRQPSTVKILVSPEQQPQWIGNLPEET